MGDDVHQGRTTRRAGLLDSEDSLRGRRPDSREDSTKCVGSVSLVSARRNRDGTLAIAVFA
ncbi:hypothetical protein [Halorussus salinisoli]|uniref:hypothetical protein n=1 Tax=Halorussus salinisoli TaxID=2558242 RepID=UPI0010C1B7C3|nr:hypothetical protein [Halorussus salinisoli]